MGNRTTMADVAQAVRRLNIASGFTPEEADAPLWSKDASGKHRAMVGRYSVQGAYGGLKLVRVINYGGGERDPLRSGYVSKREIVALINAYTEGIRAAGDAHEQLDAIRRAADEYAASVENRAASV